jgi:hypothetical protein
VKQSVLSLFTLVCLCGGVFAADEKEPAGLPDTTQSEKLVAKMPGSVAGRVLVDGQGRAGVRVTDGVNFVSTDSSGRYEIEIDPDPLLPYKPARTISVSWPTGIWPVRRTEQGRWAWWIRLMDVKDSQNVDFKFTKVEQSLPLCFGFGTDPHDAMRRRQNLVFTDEVARSAGHVDFSVMGGDLGYLGFGNADKDYTSIAEYTDKFPTILLHLIGNHDIVGIHSKWWSIPHENAGSGAFTKYLNPIRWSFDYAGIHFVGLDWALIDEKGHIQCGTDLSAIDWLEKDLKSLPAGTPAYIVSHQGWSPHQRYYDVCQKYGVKMVLGGHSHRNMFLGVHGGAEFWTKMSLYTLTYITREGFEFVDRCIYKGGRNGWNTHWRHSRRGCALVNAFTPGEKPLVGVADVTLDSASRKLKPLPGATYDLRLGARGAGPRPAARWGLRFKGADGKTREFSYSDKSNMLDLMGLKTYFNPAIPQVDDPSPEDEWVEMRIIVAPDRVRVLVNSRLHYEKFVKPGELETLEFFAEDGKAEFGRVDMWPHKYPDDYKPRRTANSG